MRAARCGRFPPARVRRHDPPDRGTAGAFGDDCAALGYGFGQAPLLGLIPPGWTPPSGDDSGTGDDGGSDARPPPTGTTTPDDSGDGSGGGSGDSPDSQSNGGSNGNDPDDLDGDGDFDDDDVNEARLRMARGELDPDEYIRLHRRHECSQPGHCE